VAAAITETFLETNGVHLVMTNDEIVRLFMEIASGALSRDQIEVTFQRKSQPMEK
jgi:prophage maintenance system killer protein